VSIIHPSIAYIHFKTFIKIYYVNCIKNFSIRLFLITNAIYLLIITQWIAFVLFRLLDEVLFLGYRKIKIEKPVFIISNPRSGTTFLQNLMASDEERFNCMKLYHAALPSITFYKIVQFLAYIDRFLGKPMEKIVNWMNGILFKGWEGIHPMGMNKNEEDEGFWFYNFTSPALSLITPHYQEIEYLNVYDKLHKDVREANLKYYHNTLKRIQFAMGKSKTMLMKSVMSSGRIDELLKLFPDARFICIERSPLKTVPSYISMFSAPWKILDPNVTKEQYKELGVTAIKFYTHFKSAREKTIEPDKLIELNYPDLIKKPIVQIEYIYQKFGWYIGPELRASLERQITQKTKFKSKHRYSLEMYGWSESELQNALNDNQFTS
jgi:hypothetical protein